MIGLRRNKRGDMVLTIDSYIDIDSTPDIQPDYFDCIYINTKSERAFHAILFGASPILSWNVATNRYSSIRRYRERNRSSTISSMPM